MWYEASSLAGKMYRQRERDGQATGCAFQGYSGVVPHWQYPTGVHQCRAVQCSVVSDKLHPIQPDVRCTLHSLQYDSCTVHSGCALSWKPLEYLGCLNDGGNISSEDGEGGNALIGFTNLKLVTQFIKGLSMKGIFYDDSRGELYNRRQLGRLHWLLKPVEQESIHSTPILTGQPRW